MLGLGDAFEYLECGDCGCLQLLEPPGDWSRYYPPSYYSRSVTPPGAVIRWLKRRRARHALGFRSPLGALLVRLRGEPPFARWIAPAGLRHDDRILDVGCGSGQVLREMSDAGFTRLTGVDPYVAGDIRLGPGAFVHKARVSDIEGPFDFVMMNHSFEHVPEPAATLAAIARLLPPGHLVLLRIPVTGTWAWREYGVDWVQLDAPRHVHLHTETSLGLLAARAGFTLKNSWYDSGAIQFWGSEQYRQGIALYDARSHAVSPRTSVFTARQISDYERRAAELNRRGDGDQACFYLERQA
jgi:SAM-dependent methyltransferase